MAKKDVWIEIKGIQKVDGEEELTELYTQGNYYKMKDHYYISYEESETTGYAGCRTTLKVEGNRCVSMIRHGVNRSSLLIERDRRNVGYYGTEVGELMIGVSAQNIDVDLNEHGGRLHFAYSLDINASHVSDNEVYIQVKEQSGHTPCV